MSTEHGKCHCGQIEWEVELDDKKHILCHCDTCKILSGGTYTLNQTVPKENIQITKGKLNTYTYHGDSGKAVNCYYCPNCTTHVYHHQTVMGNKVVVRTILLDSGKSMEPAAEIYGKARLPWNDEPRLQLPNSKTYTELSRHSSQSFMLTPTIGEGGC